MFLSILKGKIHSATVTGADVDYEGSIGIDLWLLEMSGILPNERVHVWNKANGQRFETYAIVEKPGSKKITVNGAAAHLVKPGDSLIIAAFAMMTQEEATIFQPRVVIVNSENIGKLKSA